MTDDARDSFLQRHRTCRLATVSSDGAPNMSPLWFLWDGGHMWLNSLVASQRWTDIARDSRVSLVDGFLELCGVEIAGIVAAVGDIPRSSDPDPSLAEVERQWGEKYMNCQSFRPGGRHAWLRVEPRKIVSWDFTKIDA